MVRVRPQHQRIKLSPYQSAAQTRSSKHRMNPANIVQLSNIRVQRQLLKITLKMKLKTNKFH